MIKHIRIVPLLVGIVIGIIGMVVAKPQPQVVYKYPNPKTTAQTVYKDGNGVCYRYQANEVNCDANQDKLKDYPLNK
jgi:hypothetical protein